jgi:phosphoenolpyruvate carboxykinase (ATP)
MVVSNASVDELIEEAIRRGEGVLASNGALDVRTGKYTGRSPKDKFIVRDEITEGRVDFERGNQPFPPDRFDALEARVRAYLAERDHFIFDGFAGADPKYRLPIRVITEFAWHSLFARQLFIRPTPEELEDFAPEFTVMDAALFQADPARDGTHTETFILLNFTKRLVLIGGTEYAGEIKKSVFSALNFFLPQRDVFPMHCSANTALDGSDTALFFGLSGTGKTTLSADPERDLIGDDEHGWSDHGVFNFEGGCYAKCIHLSESKEPEIWSAIRRGAVLENVVLDDHTRTPDYDSTLFTENTRAAYPLDFIPHALIPSMGGHPKTLLFLTADAFGVLPPVAKLTTEQAMFYFLSGYTSKLAGTERGVTTPEPIFSTCFAAPFLPLYPMDYARMLGERLKKHEASCYLVNTGWTGGPYGVGRRIDLGVTRAIVHAALMGTIENAPMEIDHTFGFMVPTECADVPSEILQPRNTWPDPARYDMAAHDLAALFIDNFKRFPRATEQIRAAGPKLGLHHLNLAKS